MIVRAVAAAWMGAYLQPRSVGGGGGCGAGGRMFGVEKRSTRVSLWRDYGSLFEFAQICHL